MIETARGSVHEWQRDHMGHINVRAYMDKFEEACWQLYAAVGMTPSRLRNGDARLAAVQQNISYQRELMPGDTVAIRSGVLELRDKVLRFRHEMFNTETGEISATCEFTVVCMDTATRKSRPFPPDVAERARALMIPA
jgi:acyl-CoA thioester hydrolase